MLVKDSCRYYICYVEVYTNEYSLNAHLGASGNGDEAVCKYLEVSCKENMQS